MHQILCAWLRFWNNLFKRDAESLMIGSPNNLTKFGSNKTKGPKRDSQNRLMSSKPEGEA